MCGRFTRLYKWTELHRLYALTSIPLGPEPPPWLAASPTSFNIAPTQLVPVVRAGAEVVQMQWGIRPHWAKVGGFAPINARSEDAASKPTFRAAMKSRRCLIPASGFYEWEKLDEKTKQPWYFTVKCEPVFSFAGLWEEGLDGAPPTFAMLTTKPNSVVSPYHDRMPVIVRPRLYGAWMESAADTERVFEPYPAGEIEARRVSRLVNSPKNNDESLLEGA